MPNCDIIIPTYNNHTALPRTLAALATQRIAAHWRVRIIISDDGSGDDTVQLARDTQLPPQYEVEILTSAHSGSAQARNQAVRHSQADVVVFLGADIILRPGALIAHLHFHETHLKITAAALGFVVWDPRLRPTPLMQWMTHGGQQNNYDILLGQLQADPQHFWYGSHLSVKRALLPLNPFNSVFKQYGWEDIELGRRLAAQGTTLHVLPQAVGLHYHFYSLTAICRRQEATGAGLVMYQKLHSSAALLRQRSRWHYWKHTLSTWLGLPAVLRLLTMVIAPYWTFPRLFLWVTAVYFWRGVYRRNEQ